ncbi:MAG: D-glycerate dehydrogenase [Dehalococcoidia bacterium]|nr:D-glycerate dehydrogenase [Dehalococcoidia bacterium]
MAKVYICRDFFPDVLDRLQGLHEFRVWHGVEEMPVSALLKEVPDVEGLLTCANHVTAEVFEAAPKLRVISNMGDGCDNIELAEATRRGIPVGHTPNVLTETTADLAMGLLIAAARRIVEGQSFARDGRWKAHAHLELPGVDVNSKTLGIVGLGHIGTHVAKRARAFNMRVLYYGRTRKPESETLFNVEFRPTLHDMLRESDFVVITVPLTSETRNMFGRAEFAVMKSSAILVNVGRGAIVNDDALYEALKTGRILRAALDVTSIEPLPLDRPLFTLDNIIIMPHIGSAVVETRRKMWTMAVEQFLTGLRGDRIPNCINSQVYREA